MRNACAKAKAATPDVAIDGEMQFDAAVSPTVGQTQVPRLSRGRLCQHLYFPQH